MTTRISKLIVKVIIMGTMGINALASVQAMDDTGETKRNNESEWGVLNIKGIQFRQNIDKNILTQSTPHSLNSVLRTCKLWNLLAPEYTLQLRAQDRYYYEFRDSYAMYCSDECFVKFKNLTHLTLGESEKITDNSLSTMTNLTYLSFNDKCEKITGNSFSALSNLTYLELDTKSNISDWCLGKLTNLITLILYENKKITGQGIKNLIKLRSLYLRCENTWSDANKKITDESLENLENLTDLNLDSNNTITNGGINTLLQLKKLDLSSNKKITDSALKLLTKLTHLALDQNKQITNAALKRLTNIVVLHLSSNQVITIDGIINLNNLTYLHLRGNTLITDWGLQKLTNLSYLDLGGNPDISDEGIRNLTNLTTLNLLYNKKITSDGIKNLINLTSILNANSQIFTSEVLMNLIKLHNREKLIELRTKEILKNKKELVRDAKDSFRKGTKAEDINSQLNHYTKAVDLYLEALTIDFVQPTSEDRDNYENAKRTLIGALAQYLADLDKRAYPSK